MASSLSHSCSVIIVKIISLMSNEKEYYKPVGHGFTIGKFYGANRSFKSNFDSFCISGILMHRLKAARIKTNICSSKVILYIWFGTLFYTQTLIFSNTARKNIMQKARLRQSIHMDHSLLDRIPHVKNKVKQTAVQVNGLAGLR